MSVELRITDVIHGLTQNFLQLFSPTVFSRPAHILFASHPVNRNHRMLEETAGDYCQRETLQKMLSVHVGLSVFVFPVMICWWVHENAHRSEDNPSSEDTFVLK